MTDGENQHVSSSGDAMTDPLVDRQTLPQLIRVQFDLPFVLFVRDSMTDPELEAWAEAWLAGVQPLPYAKYAPSAAKPEHIVFGSGLPVFIPKKPLAPPFQIRLPFTTAILSTLRRVNVMSQCALVGEVSGDRMGRASFSTVLVHIYYADLPPSSRDDPMFQLRTAVDVVNHFIRHYRVIADRPWVNVVDASQVGEYQLSIIDENEEQHNMRSGFSCGSLRGFGGALDDATEATLRRAVAQDGPPDVAYSLRADINDHLFLGEWRLALIEVAILFEALLARQIRTRLESKGATPIEIEKVFVDDQNRPRSVTHLASKTWKEITGFDFGASPEFAAWATHVRDVRNELVHGKRFDVTEVEAPTAVRVVSEAITLLLAP